MPEPTCTCKSRSAADVMEGRGDAGRRPQTQSRGAGGHAAQKHAAPGGRKEDDRRCRYAGKIGQVEICCYYHMRANGNPPVTAVPDFLDYEMWTGPAPFRPYDGLPHLRWCGRSWNMATASSATCASTCSTPCAGCSIWAGRRGSTSTGGIYVQTGGKSNISDTQTAAFEYP